MNIGIYQNAASLSALERWQDAVTQNISSSQIPGYRERTVNVSGQDNGQFTIAADAPGGPESSQPASFPTAAGGVNFTSGETKRTGRPLDVAIQSAGFFQVQMPDGSSAYTRNGGFGVRTDGTLVDSSNHPILSDSGSALVIAPGGGDPTITQDGMISQGTTPIGRLAVQSFANPRTLVPISGGLFVSSSTDTPTTVTHPDLIQGFLESSNVSPLFEMVSMVQISRAYEANQKVISNADQQTQKTMDALG